MIRVKNFVKKFAGVEAVKGISFTVNKGEIVGFLGPNGAGKSTTMRVLTGYLAPTSGEIKIAGHNLIENTLDVRKKLGYMPENVPLYHEMRVSEYLNYRALLKQIPRKKIRARVQDVMAQCGVADVRDKVIASLSKGYRQRLGLADALVHDPELLILDEPTAGLDPNQIRAVRELIKDLGKKRTVLLSTHILSEVEMVCDRAIIIHKGKIEASDSLDNLRKKVQSGSLFIEIKAPRESALEKLLHIAQISSVEICAHHGEWISLECTSKPGEDSRQAVDELIKHEHWPLREFRRDHVTLEDVFVELTQE
ncbi:MAG: ABC transporter ATP-binding protein [Verrucomicrobiota bacterium]